MSRYFTAFHPLFVEPLWEDEPHRTNVSVSEHVATDTGLVDHRGHKIVRAPNEVGFHHPRGRK